ncbi:hypothetical protein OPV22_030473 [Ensete ventricosum]|uniref:Auxin response factor domain-containing protein n=1 Tax=Ensete ventricosum TaxID=4639 RepID=A0AAV8Q665_ENSVE|nr:hypothetical protein OPV22_030473 [Ensete ventricosum]
MEGFLCLVEQPRKSSLPWISRCTHQLRSLLLVTFTMFNGSSGTSTEVNRKGICLLQAGVSHAAATNSHFTIPRTNPSEFMIPLSKYVKAVFHTRVSAGMRFRMLFETEECNIRRYMGTITGTSDLDLVRWPNSHWRSVKVG